MHPIGHLADAAARDTLAGGELEGMRIQLIAPPSWCCSPRPPCRSSSREA
ncbi:hypothetical protein [Streptomyces paradoxus]